MRERGISSKLLLVVGDWPVAAAMSMREFKGLVILESVVIPNKSRNIEYLMDSNFKVTRIDIPYISEYDWDLDEYYYTELPHKENDIHTSRELKVSHRSPVLKCGNIAIIESLTAQEVIRSDTGGSTGYEKNSSNR